MAHLPPTRATLIDAVAELESFEVARDLVTIIGRPLVALVTDVSNTQVIRTWTDDGVVQEARREIVLRYALQAARIILTRFDRRVVQRWFAGGSSTLGDNAPSAVLRRIVHDESRAEQLRAQVLQAARAFVNR